MTKKGKQLKEKYQWEIKSQYKGKIFEGDCRVKITLFFKRKGIADIDNFNKLVIDSLQGIILKNDSQIQELLIKKDYSKENPRIEIELLKIKKLEKELK